MTAVLGDSFKCRDGIGVPAALASGQRAREAPKVRKMSCDRTGLRHVLLPSGRLTYVNWPGPLRAVLSNARRAKMFPALEPFPGPGVPVQLLPITGYERMCRGGGKRTDHAPWEPGRTGFVWREKSKWPLETLASESKRPR